MKHSVRHAATAYLVGNGGIDRQGGQEAQWKPPWRRRWSGNGEA
jgi:hypothetical protein